MVALQPVVNVEVQQLLFVVFLFTSIKCSCITGGGKQKPVVDLESRLWFITSALFVLVFVWFFFSFELFNEGCKVCFLLSLSNVHFCNTFSLSLVWKCAPIKLFGLISHTCLHSPFTLVLPTFPNGSLGNTTLRNQNSALCNIPAPALKLWMLQIQS